MHAGSSAEAARWGKYEVLRPLAVGGMAELYLARSQDPDRLVVLKRLRAPLALDPEFVRMFLDEGHLAMTLRHPNVVEVYEVGEDAGRYFMAMEYLHGHDLRETMARLTARHAKVPIAQALSVARAVAAALHYTHERTGGDGESLGIVHRDVSPHNVLLTYDGRVKLVDFGIAKTASQRSRTRTGVLKGKVAYMAPEQALGLPIDRRSDLFCLGILMWEMITGRWLYRLRTELDTLNAVARSRPPRPSRVTADCPRDLERLIMKALARSPADRFATAAELTAAIDDVARRRKITLGPEQIRALSALAFADELAAWQAVQGLGISLADHLVAQHVRAAARVPDPDADIEGDDAEVRDDEYGESPPLPVLEITRRERFSRARARWPVFAMAGGASVAAIASLAMVWLATREASTAVPPAPSSPPSVAPSSAASSTAPVELPREAPAPPPAPPPPSPAAALSGTAAGAATGSAAVAPPASGLASGTAAVRAGGAEPASPAPPRASRPAKPAAPRDAAARGAVPRAPGVKAVAKPSSRAPAAAARATTPAVPPAAVPPPATERRAPAAVPAPATERRAPAARPPTKPTDAELDKLP